MRTPTLVLVIAAAASLVAACGGDDDITPPTIVSITPAPAAPDMWMHTPIVVTFSEPMAAATIDGASVVLGATGSTTGTAAGPAVAVSSSATLSSDGVTLTVIADATAAGLGELHLDLTDVITDRAGNPLAATTATWQLDAWSRPASGLDRDPNPATPALALTADGTPIVAWSVGASSPRRIVVSRIDAGGATALGGALGAQDAALPSIAVDADGHPIVVWSQFSTAQDPAPVSIQAARWDGAAWQPLPSPGLGSAVVVATPPGGGDPVIAWSTGTDDSNRALAVRTLASGAAGWQAFPGGDLALGSPIVGLPALEVPVAGAPVVAFVEGAGGVGAAGQTLRVLRHDNAWTEQPSIPLGPPPPSDIVRVALAATTVSLFVAFDQHDGGSFGSHVLARSGMGWIRLGTELDVDPPADAQAPTLAVDITGAPVVAWRERVEGAWRGFVMRWNGAAWIAVGGDAWNTDTTRQIVRPRMALWRGRVPIIAWGTGSASGMGVALWNGPAAPRLGRDARASIAGCSVTSATPPATLSATGCFTIAGGKAIPHPGLVPFDLRSELWSDGALKRRWLALPDGTSMITPESGAWTAPLGAMMVKEFAYEPTPGDGGARRVMETRFLVQDVDNGSFGTWLGFSYRWRADGSDADLLPDAASTVAWPLAAGGTHTHSYPSRAECARCHHASNGPLLGLRAGQLARRADYDGIMAEQLATMTQLGVIATKPEIIPFAAPFDARASLEQRMRGYLAANCSHCHNPGGERPTRDFRWETPLAQTNLCAVMTPGTPSTSLVYQRVSVRPGMPPLATLQADPMIVAILSQWISGIAACP